MTLPTLSIDMPYLVRMNFGTNGKIDKTGNTNGRYHRQNICITLSALNVAQLLKNNKK